MAYRRAFSTLGCPDLTLEEALKLAGRHGYPAIELRLLEGTTDLPAVLRRAHGTPAALAEKLAGGRVGVASFDASLRLVENSAPDRADLLALVPWAEALRVPYLRVFDGGHAADPAELQRAGPAVRWWREQRAEHGWQVDLMVETHDSLLGADAVERFVAAFPGVKILWDAHHTWRRGGEAPLATWARIRDHVVHIHVKDSASRPSDGLAYTYVPPGEGEFPARELFAALQRDFAGTVSLEWERHWHPALPPLEVALAAAGRHGW